MSDLPTSKALVSYWIVYVGIGNPIQKVYVPLTDILKYTLPNGKPQTNVVIISGTTFNGDPSNFTAPYWSIDEGVIKELTVQPGESTSNVQKLQAAGIKVLLGVVGRSGMGWEHVPAADNRAFASWVKSDVIDKYGVDGIDIDDEFSGLGHDPQSFVNTVAALRESLGDQLITKALWDDLDQGLFTTPVSANAPHHAGRYLGQMLDAGWSMDYGDPPGSLKTFIEGYTDISVGDVNVGMDPSQLCIGVQAGVGNWMTTIPTTEEVSQWVVDNGYMGIMLYTFSQDIQQWTHQPQNSPGYMFPNEDDHEWQKAIIDTMWGR